MLAAVLTRIAKESQISQLDNGPLWNTKVSVQPRLSARLHSANTYAENTAGPINAETNAPNCCAVSVAQIPKLLNPAPILCNIPVVHTRAGSIRTVIAVVLLTSAIILLPRPVLRCTSGAESCALGFVELCALSKVSWKQAESTMCKKFELNRRKMLVTRSLLQRAFSY